MTEYIVDNYAHLLTKDDAIRLFQSLIDAYGNRDKASKICGLERKTTYNWSQTKEMKIETKKKILSVFFDLYTEETFDFITQKSVEDSVDLVYLLLSSIIGQVSVGDSSSEELSRLYVKFNEVKTKYESLIRQHLDEELGDMIENLLVNKPDDIAFTMAPPNFIKISDLSEILPMLIEEVHIKPPNVSINQLAENWNISLTFINSISTGLKIIEGKHETVSVEPLEVMIDPGIMPTTNTLSAGTASPYLPSNLSDQFKILHSNDFMGRY